jgi:hypothetical protein
MTVVFAPDFRLLGSHAGTANTVRGAVAGIQDLPDRLDLVPAGADIFAMPRGQ